MMNNRILLCVDGTDESVAVVHNAAGVLSAKTCEITLLHVMNKVPEALLDMGKDTKWFEKVEKVKAFEEKQRAYIARFTDVMDDPHEKNIFLGKLAAQEGQGNPAG